MIDLIKKHHIFAVALYERVAGEDWEPCVMACLKYGNDEMDVASNITKDILDNGMLHVFVDSPDWDESSECIKVREVNAPLLSGTCIDLREDEETLFEWKIEIIRVA